MKIRVIQLMNNFFRDENGTATDKEKALGMYCTFGYFDALEVKEGKNFSDTEKSIIWEEIEEVAVNTLDGTCSRRNLVCMTDEDEKDERFWKNARHFPYLFVSLIRMKHDREDMDTIHKVMDELRDDDKVIAYFCYNHSELVLAKLEKSYIKGMCFVLEMREKLKSLNIHSIFSVKEEIIKSEEKIQEEIEGEEVAVQLRMMIKRDQEIEGFLQRLWDTLFVDEIRAKTKGAKECFEKYYTLGSNDMVIRIGQISMHKLLACYSMGNLLTHTNEQFAKAVYNIQTEILVEGEQIKYGKTMDTGKTGEPEATA